MPLPHRRWVLRRQGMFNCASRPGQPQAMQPLAFAQLGDQLFQHRHYAIAHVDGLLA